MGLFFVESRRPFYRAFSTGWGTTLSSESNRILHGAEIPIINQQACINAYSRAGTITPRMMCAGLLNQGGKDSCQGWIFKIDLLDHLKWSDSKNFAIFLGS